MSTELDRLLTPEPERNLLGPYNHADYDRLRQRFSRGDIAEDRDAAFAAREFVWYCDNRVRPEVEALQARVRELEGVAVVSANAIQNRDDRIQELRVQGEGLVGALRKFEWSDVDSFGNVGYCPLCRQPRSNRHSRNCPLRATLEGKDAVD